MAEILAKPNDVNIVPYLIGLIEAIEADDKDKAEIIAGRMMLEAYKTQAKKIWDEMNKPCPEITHSHYNPCGEKITVKKKDCSECWQELGESVK